MGTFLVFVDDLTRIYNKPSDLGYNHDATEAPFAGKTPHECSLMLKALSEGMNPSDLDSESFAILDERSLTDGTLVLVGEAEEQDGGEQATVRIVFDMVESQILLWASGKTTVEEDRVRAESTVDGVLRAGMDL